MHSGRVAWRVLACCSLPTFSLVWRCAGTGQGVFDWPAAPCQPFWDWGDEQKLGGSQAINRHSHHEPPRVHAGRVGWRLLACSCLPKVVGVIDILEQATRRHTPQLTATCGLYSHHTAWPSHHTYPAACRAYVPLAPASLLSLPILSRI
jgi:hypothetical protein